MILCQKKQSDISTQIIEKAKEFGASSAGIADVAALKKFPSHDIYGKLDAYRGVGTRKGIKTNKLSYFIERGGIFLKDAAAMAGMGCIGKNNMLVTPEFGPRVRLRAMLAFEALPITEPADFDPCHGCAACLVRKRVPRRPLATGFNLIKVLLIPPILLPYIRFT